MELGITGTGQTQHMPVDRVRTAQAAFEKRVQDAAKFNRHVWITTVTHSMTEQQARAVLDGTAGDQLLDVETVAVTGIGCYRCEHELSQEAIDQACPGDPAERQLLSAIQAALEARDLPAVVELSHRLAVINPAAAQKIVDTVQRAAGR